MVFSQSGSINLPVLTFLRRLLAETNALSVCKTLSVTVQVVSAGLQKPNENKNHGETEKKARKNPS